MVKQHFEQSLKQTQKLILSQQMQQSLKILQMPVMELHHIIAQEIEENPLLEYSDSEIETNHVELLESLGKTFKQSCDGDDLQSFLENTYQTQEDVEQQLTLQVHEKVPKSLWPLAFDLIGNLDSNGLLTTDLKEIAVIHDHDLDDLHQVLEILKTFEPTGLFAQSLQEALLLQLKQLGKENSLAYVLVDKFFDEILHNRIQKIEKKVKSNAHKIHNVIQNEILTLNFHPLESPEQAQAIFPDASILLEDEELKILIHQDQLPPIRFNNSYLKMLKDEGLSKETRGFLNEKLSKGQRFVKNLQQRESTLHRITEKIAEYQNEFFKTKEGALKPLTMKDLSLELGLHESTIARAVSNKYLYSTKGIFPLKHFFSYGYTSEAGEISSTTIKDLIQKLVEQESSNSPLSDQDISKQIQKKGIDCARRTVAKYRKELGIGTMTQRKRF